MKNAMAIEGRKFQSPRGNDVPPVGNVLPRERYTSDDVAAGQAKVLRLKYGRMKSPAKEQARDTGQSERACRNQQAGKNCMNLTEFFNACQTVPEFRAWGAMMMGLEIVDPAEFQREMARGTREIVIRVEGGGAVVQQKPQNIDPENAVHDLFSGRRRA